PGLGEQCIVGRGERLGEPAGLVPGDAVGHGEQRALGHRHQFCLAAATADGHDPVADGEPAGTRPEADHHAGDATGAGYRPLRCNKSAALTPAAATVTSTSPCPGWGSACSRHCSAPSTMVTACIAPG